ncbi:hypothetical protein [Nonomuraea sp. LPB2021202275-12-8]|uniref:hypothetical protein n=1 Tax=Nonomuraea sp. LPB2021202275-12-8 TaxID=3120159 RepID=UPI00300C5AA8
MNPDLTISVPIRIAQSADDTRVKAETTGVGEMAVPGTNALVGELLKTNQAGPSGLQYVLYGQKEVPIPDLDPADLHAHFATMNHDLPAMTAWLRDLFAV